MNEFYDNIEELQVGIDEAGRGCLLGPVSTAAVIMNNIHENHLREKLILPLIFIYNIFIKNILHI